jgi:hypothetical protein
LARKRRFALWPIPLDLDQRRLLMELGLGTLEKAVLEPACLIGGVSHDQDLVGGNDQHPRFGLKGLHAF